MATEGTGTFEIGPKAPRPRAVNLVCQYPVGSLGPRLLRPCRPLVATSPRTWELVATGEVASLIMSPSLKAAPAGFALQSNSVVS